MRFTFILLCLIFITSCGTRRNAVKVTEPNRKAVKIEIPETDIPSETNIKTLAKPINKPRKKDIFCAKNTKMRGYRIQIYFSKKRDNWQTTERHFRTQYPNLDVLMKYSPPHYRILAGQYLNRTSAKLDLIKIRRNHPDAMIVSWNIWCKHAR